MRRTLLAAALATIVAPCAAALPDPPVDSCLAAWPDDPSGDPWDCESWVDGRVCAFVPFLRDESNPYQWWGSWVCTSFWI